MIALLPLSRIQTVRLFIPVAKALFRNLPVLPFCCLEIVVLVCMYLGRVRSSYNYLCWCVASSPTKCHFTIRRGIAMVCESHMFHFDIAFRVFVIYFKYLRFSSFCFSIFIFIQNYHYRYLFIVNQNLVKSRYVISLRIITVAFNDN